MNAPATTGKSASQRAALNYPSLERLACALPADMQLDLIEAMLKASGLADDASVHFWRDLRSIREEMRIAEQSSDVRRHYAMTGETPWGAA